MSDLEQEVALLRQYIERLEHRIEALEDEGADLDLDAWVARNKDALNDSIREGRESLARGDYIEGTVDELRARFFSDARQASAKD